MARTVLPIAISVRSIFVCATMVWQPVFGIFNVHTDVDVCDCTWGAVRTL